ncbi:glycosyltransferase family 4 protein [candidate division KSB1 bacterium]|nr:glycosyltransferase family 4 protein [candidate division KSB1 bacterium]MBL7093480.1 glycosyltransferase family 4 protein [candidate division KSB1 bacterium]
MKTNSIKILHIDTGKSWRGGQQQAIYLFNALHEKGYKTALVCNPQSPLEKYCQENNLPLYPISMKGEVDFVAGLKIALICKKRGYNILHLHSSHALATGLWAKLFYPKLKLIAVRRVDFDIKKNWFSQYKYNTNKVDKIVCISEAIKKVLLKNNIPDEKLITIRSGINIHKFERVKFDENFKSELKIPENHIIVGTIAALTGHKDYPNLLKAAKIVLQKFANVTFIALGDGPQKEKIFRLTEAMKLQNNFVFMGFQKNIGLYLKMFNIFVSASKLEGLGTSILDAQAVGLPIAACKTGGVPEAVKHNYNGLLVPPGDSVALAEAISTLVSDEKTRMKYGKNALNFVKKFDIKNTVKKNIELYESMLN